MINVAVIGYGYWGPNLLRNFAECRRVTVKAVSDARERRLEAASRRYPAVGTTTDPAEVLNDPGIDLVAIATPVESHYALALEALRNGKHVLVEKPMTQTAEQARELLEEAERNGVVLMVDHTFIYTGAVRKIRELVDAGELGQIYYYDSSRINLGLFQHDVDVIWDLAVHDFAILDYILDERPLSVAAHGVAHVDGRPENLAYVTLFYASGAVAHINVNWLAPVKLRRTLIGGSRKMIVYDDLEPDEKIKLYDKGITASEDPGEIYEMRIGYRVGDVWSPQLERAEALKTEVNHLADCIEKGVSPRTGGAMGLRVVEMLEAATTSMHDRGRPVELAPEKVST
jgi:predicted dehydrogenase